MSEQQSRLLSLDWLVSETADLRSKIDAFDVSDENAWSELRVILSHKLSSGNINRLAKAIGGLEKDSLSALRVTPVKVLFIGAATFEHVQRDMIVAALRHNIYLEVMFADFGQAAQLSFTPDPEVQSFAPDLVFFYDDYRSLENEDVKKIGSDGPAGRLEQVLRFAKRYNQHYGALTVFNTIVPPIDGMVADADRLLDSSTKTKVLTYNMNISEALEGSDHILFDLDHLASMAGYWTWCDTTYWLLAKLPFHPDCNALFCDRFGSLLAAFRGKSRRALVLDCDNTVWGGVIGDDGMEGIKIGQGSAAGEAHSAVQRTALALRERGVVLAVSSKNTHEVAIEAFKNHPDMLLRENDIALFRINWTDKAANISDIAKTLNLGLQSFVFLDDNPAERARVRNALPEVAVPEIGSNASDYPSMLIQAGYFNAIGFSEEDKKRADMYANNAQRAEALEAMDDFGDYLKSMNMKISLNSFDSIGRSRIAQLISKSNQFNLTTRRYSSAEVEEIEADDAKYDLQIRLTDTYGDNGMISVVVATKSPEEWHIDLWLMSCRVLGRRVEEQTLSKLVTDAKAAGVKRLLGTYIPTDRNKIVEDHYKKLGFEFSSKENDGSTLWILDIESYTVEDLPFTIINQ